MALTIRMDAGGGPKGPVGRPRGDGGGGGHWVGGVGEADIYPLAWEFSTF